MTTLTKSSPKASVLPRTAFDTQPAMTAAMIPAIERRHQAEAAPDDVVAQEPGDRAEHDPGDESHDSLLSPRSHGSGRAAASVAPQRVRGKPRSTFEVPGSGQRDVTILARV